MCSAVFKCTRFQYRLIAIPDGDLKGCVIARQHTVTTDDTQPLAHFKLYAYPFQDFPAVESHLRPHFVIHETGRQLKSLAQEVVNYMSLHYTILPKVVDIYDAWMSKLPEGCLSDQEFNPQDSQEHSEDEDDNKTARGRCKNTRKRPGDGGSPTGRIRSVKARRGDPRQGGKQQHDAEVETAVDDEMESRRYGNAGNAVACSRPSHSSGKNSVGLSGKTLRDHYERVGKASTAQRTSEWVSDCLVSGAKKSEEYGASWTEGTENAGQMVELALFFSGSEGGDHGW